MLVLTGGAGMIGSCFLAKLNAEGVEDVLVVDELQTSEKWKNLLGKTYIDYVHKEEFIKLIVANKITAQVRAIVHLGANFYTTETNMDSLMRDSLAYTRVLAEYAMKCGARFIYASSAATYGDGSQGYSDSHTACKKLLPLNRYGYSKQLFDMHALRAGWLGKIAGLKFFNVYGPNEFHKTGQYSAALAFYQQAESHGQVKLFKSYNPDFKDGEQRRDFVYVKDCMNIMWWLLQKPEVNGIFNVGSGKSRTWKDMAQAVFAALGKHPRIDFIDMPEQLRNQYQYFTEAPMDKLRAAGWQTPMTSLEDGVKDYVQGYLQKAHPYM